MSGNTDVDEVVIHDTDINTGNLTDLEDSGEDLPDDEPVEQEAEDTEDDQPEGEVGEDEGDGDSDESEDADESEPEGDAPKGKDLALTKLQQRQTTFEREVKSQLETILKAVNKAGDKPTEKQEQAVEDATDELAGLLGSHEDDDIVDVATLKKIVGKIQSKKPVDVQTLVSEAIEAREAQQAQQQKELDDFLKQEEAELYEMYPQLDGRFVELTDQASGKVAKSYGLKPGDAGFDRKFNFVYADICAREAAKATDSPKPAPARKAGTKPPKSATGANTKPVGASAPTDASSSSVVFHDNKMDQVYDLRNDDN